MNCQDISRILDSRDVNALAADERRACEAHAASCPQCGSHWIVYTRLAAIPAPSMPQQFATRCEVMAAAQLGAGSVHRPPSWTVLLGTILVVAAAAAVLVAHLMSPSPETALQGSSLEAAVRLEAPAMAGPLPRAPVQGLAPDASPVQPVTVNLLLDQVTADAIGRDYGQRVFEGAREELRALPGVVLVDAGTAEAAPAFRITYFNLAESSGSSVQVEMVFQVEAYQSGADGAGTYKPVFRSSPPPPGVVAMPLSIRQLERIPSFNQEPWMLASSARVSPRPAAMPAVSAECIDRRESRCPYTPADIAAYTILSWHLHTTSPDPALAERLHAMLRDPSSPPGLWLMALVNLHEYRKLRLDMPELLAASERIGGDDPALRAELVRDAIKVESRADVMRRVRDLLLREPPNGGRSPGNRMGLVELLATEFRTEPEARGTLELVAATDPDYEIRAAAKRALGAKPEPRPQPPPTPSYMGPVEEE